MAVLGAVLFTFIILFSWHHFMSEMFNLPSMRFTEALGATGLLFSAGFLLNPGKARVQDRLHDAPSEQESTSAGRKAGDLN